MNKRIILFLLITAVPILAGMTYALLYSLGLFGVLAKGLTFTYWKEILLDSNIYQSVLFSIAISLVAVVVSFLLSFKLYPVFLKKLHANQLWLFVPLGIPPMVWAFFHYLMFTGSGLLSRIVFHIGMINDPTDFPRLVNDNLGISIILSQVVMATPFFILYFIRIHHSEKIDKLIELTRNFGGKSKVIKRKVVLPVILNKSRALLILYAIFIAGSYEVPLLLGSQSPRMITVFILDKMLRFDITDKPVAYGLAFMYVLIVVSIIIVLSLRGRRYGKG